MIRTTARNATLGDLAEILRDQQARKLDVVAPATALRAVEGNLVLAGTEPILTPDGVSTGDGTYRPTAVADEGLASRLGIPVGYLKSMRSTRPDLYDANVNGWLHGRRPKVRRSVDGTEEVVRDGVDPDGRNFLIRAFRGDAPGDVGIARAVLSDRYRMVDNLDVLTAALDGVRASGANVEIRSCDLTDRRMYVKVYSPDVVALAPELLRNYRSPFDGGDDAPRRAGWTIDRARDVAAREGLGYEPGEEPVVFGGFKITNSETGGGALSIVPELYVEICRNGLTIKVDALREVHLGGTLDEGIVRWSDETQQKALDLVTARARDAVATFLDHDYVVAKVTEIETRAGAPISNPADAVREVGKRLRFTQEQTDGILDHFIRGGQLTAGGIANAVTSYSQTVDDADVADELDAAALDALAVAAS